MLSDSGLLAANDPGLLERAWGELAPHARA